MTERTHPIDEIKYNKYRDRHIEQVGQEAYRQHEESKVQEAVSILTKELLECFNKYHHDVVIKGIVHGCNKTHRHTQTESINGIVNVFGELANNLDNKNFDGRNEYALQVLKNMHMAATNNKVIDFIEKLKKEKTNET